MDTILAEFIDEMVPQGVVNLTKAQTRGILVATVKEWSLRPATLGKWVKKGGPVFC